jgi:hypothetical protein
VTDKLIVCFDHPHDRYGLEDGFVLHAEGEHFEELLSGCEHDATKFPIQETVPGGGRIMVWEGERHRERQWDSDDCPYFVGAWRPATALDLVDADLLGGIE